MNYSLMIFIRKVAFLVPTSYLQKFLFAKINAPTLRHNKFQTNWNLLSDILYDLFSESLYLQRVPVLPVISLEGKQINMPIQKLLNLEKSFLITPEGETIKLSYIHQQEYIKIHRSSSFSKFNTSRYIDEFTNATTVLAIRCGGKKVGLNKNLKDIERIRFISQIKVQLEPSKRITDIAEKISNQLKDYYFLSYQNPFSFAYTGQVNNLQDLINEIGFLYPKKYNILKPLISGQGLLDNLMKIYPEGSRLYIASQLSEAMKQELLMPLQRCYDIFEANDFLELANLNLSQSPIDKVELEILEECIQKKSLHAMSVKFLPLWDYPSGWESIVRKPSEKPQGFSEGLAYRQ